MIIDLTIAHKQIESCFFDELPTVAPDYRTVIVEPLDAVVSGKNITFPYKVRIFDRPNLEGKTLNDREIISDCTTIALDFITYFYNTKFAQPLTANEEAIITPVQWQLEDLATGVEFTLTLSQVIDFNACMIPMNGVHVDENANVAFIVDEDTGEILYRLPVGQRFGVKRIRSIIDTIDNNTDNIVIDPLP